MNATHQAHLQQLRDRVYQAKLDRNHGKHRTNWPYTGPSLERRVTAAEIALERAEREELR